MSEKKSLKTIKSIIFIFPKAWRSANKNAGAFALLAIIAAVLIFWGALCIENKKIENILSTENDINISFAKIIEREAKKAKEIDKIPDWTFFDKFSTFLYRQNWDYIQKKHSTNCVELYKTAVTAMEGANNIIDALQYLDYNMSVLPLSEDKKYDASMEVIDYKNLLIKQACMIKAKIESIKNNDCRDREVECLQIKVK